MELTYLCELKQRANQCLFLLKHIEQAKFLQTNSDLHIFVGDNVSKYKWKIRPICLSFKDKISINKKEQPLLILLEYLDSLPIVYDLRIIVYIDDSSPTYLSLLENIKIGHPVVVIRCKGSLVEQ